MKYFVCSFFGMLLASLLLITCSKPTPQELRKPSLYITVKDDTGKSVSGAIVRLYKNATDTGITQISDSAGTVFFADLDTVRYHWLAVSGCKTNRVSQTTLNRSFVSNIVYYGYSVMSETGTIKIINNSPEAYIVSDSVARITINKDTPYIAHRRVRSYLVRSERVSTPGVGRDTIIRIRCADTTVLNIPY